MHSQILVFPWGQMYALTVAAIDQPTSFNFLTKVVVMMMCHSPCFFLDKKWVTQKLALWWMFFVWGLTGELCSSVILWSAGLLMASAHVYFIPLDFEVIWKISLFLHLNVGDVECFSNCRKSSLIQPVVSGDDWQCSVAGWTWGSHWSFLLRQSLYVCTW